MTACLLGSKAIKMLFCTLPLLSQYTVCHVVDVLVSVEDIKVTGKEQDTMHARENT
jgi:hypothetical protein